MQRPVLLAAAIAGIFLLSVFALPPAFHAVGSPRSATAAPGAHPAGLVHPVTHPSPARTARSVPSTAAPLITPGLTVIYPNGTVSNGSAPISVAGNLYTLTAGFTGGLLDERNSSVLNGAGKTLNQLSSLPAAIEVFQAQGVTVDNFTIVNASYGIHGVDASALTVIKNVINASDWAIEVDDSSGIAVTGNTAVGTWGSEYYLDFGVSVSGNDFKNSSREAVYAEYCSNVSASHNQGSGSNVGVEGYADSGVTVWGNNLSKTLDGVYFEYVQHAIVSWNNASLGTYPIEFYYSAQITGTSNSGSGGSEAFYVEYCSNVQFTLENFANFSSEGAYLGYSSNVSLSQSSFVADDYSVYAYYVSDLWISHDNLSRGSYGVYLDYSSNAVVTNNTIFGEGYGSFEAYYGYENANVLVANNTAPGAEYGVYDEYSTHLVIRSNDFAHAISFEYAIYLYEDGSVVVSGNDLFNASSYGVYAEYINSLQILSNNVSYSGYEAMYVYESSAVTIDGNAVDHAAFIGLDVEYVTQFSIVGNPGGFTSATDGEGLFLDESSGGTAIGNTATHTNLSLDVEYCSNVQVSNNNASSSVYGIWEEYANNVTFAGNQFWADKYAFEVVGGANVWIYHNNFVGDQGWTITNTSVVGNFHWDNGYPSGGNYWSNHTGPDAKGGPGQNLTGADGIVDTALVINATMSDRYPLAAPWTVYLLEFTASGLASGLTWSVTVNGMTLTSQTPTIDYAEPYGASAPFQYTVGRVTGYNAPSPASGSGTMAHANAAFSIAFTPFTYTVTFHEVGLTAGTDWSVTVNSVVQSGTGPDITASLSNGTWTYATKNISGYALTTPAGSVNVRGIGPVITVTYIALNNSSGTPTTVTITVSSGYTSTTVYSLLGALVVALLLAILGFVLYARARRPKSPPAATPWSAPPSGAQP
ncbi:MAG: right-handed parallel beta-helix repeat-containing protein, partial [Candidatus Lutacidiplasmatales archaeon]